MKKCSVLIIENDIPQRNALVSLAEKEGLAPVVCSDCQEGVKKARSLPPDIVLININVPDCKGLEFLKKLRVMLPRVQIIVITAFDNTDIAIEALREGALDYIKKPVDMHFLSLALCRAKDKIHKSRNAPRFPVLLLVEDEDVTRKRLAKELEKEGWIVHQAANGEEAIEIFNQDKIDIALLDIKMPKKDGLATLHEMRAVSDDFEAIILSGYGDESSAIQAMRDGAMNFLKKPIDLDQMIMAVEKAIEKTAINRALKFRTRELELAEELLAKFTSKKEIVIDIRNHSDGDAREFAQRLLDAIPIGMMIVDSDMKILYINEHISRVVEYKPEGLDGRFVSLLSRIGIKGLPVRDLQKSIRGILNAPMGTIESLNVGKFSSIALTQVFILDDKKKEKVVLVIMRGERPMNRGGE